MSTDRDLQNIVRSWLDESVPVLPERVLDAALDQIAATPQRHAFGWARRYSLMTTPVKIGLAAAVLAAVVIGGIWLFPGTGGLGSEPTPSPTPIATPIPSLGTQDSIHAGRYQVDAGPGVQVTVDIPAGWSSNNNWVAIGPRQNAVPDGMAIRFYQVVNLFTDPQSQGELNPPVGPTVANLVDAVVNHPGWTATTPTDITIDGRAGQLVSFAIPADAPLTGSDPKFYMFLDHTGGSIYGWAPEQTFDLYIVDVDGVRVVIEAFHYPGTSADDLAAQRTVVQSVQLDPAP